jgi:hypothetical protein
MSDAAYRARRARLTAATTLATPHRSDTSRHVDLVLRMIAHPGSQVLTPHGRAARHTGTPEQPVTFGCGTAATYKRRGCRCDDCRKAQSERREAWRKRP